METENKNLEDKILHSIAPAVGATIGTGSFFLYASILNKVMDELSIEKVSDPLVFCYGLLGASLLTGLKVFQACHPLKGSKAKKFFKNYKANWKELIPFIGFPILCKHARNYDKLYSDTPEEKRDTLEHDAVIHRTVDLGAYHAIVSAFPGLYMAYQGIKYLF